MESSKFVTLHERAFTSVTIEYDMLQSNAPGQYAPLR